MIYVELVEAEEKAIHPIAYAIDQAHNVEPKIEAMILSVMNLQEVYTKALLINRAALQEARQEGDVLSAHRVLLDAYNTDVRSLCAKVRADLGASVHPISDFRRGRYIERVAEERKEESQVNRS